MFGFDSFLNGNKESYSYCVTYNYPLPIRKIGQKLDAL